MNIFSHYIWESEGEKANPSSVVLQQIKVGKKTCILICICDGKKEGEQGVGTAGYITECLVEWFHHRCIPKLCEDSRFSVFGRVSENRWGKIQDELENEIRRCFISLSVKSEQTKELESTQEQNISPELCGMLMLEDQFCYFVKGNTRGYLFNRKFNKKQCKDLHDLLFGKQREDNLLVISGELQKGVCVLIGTAGYCEYISKEELLEVLFVEKDTEFRMQKKLREIWKENLLRGGEKYVGAIFVRTD